MEIVFGSTQANGAMPAEVHFTEGVYAGHKLTGDGKRDPQACYTPPPIVELRRQLKSGAGAIAMDRIETDYEQTGPLLVGCWRARGSAEYWSSADRKMLRCRRHRQTNSVRVCSPASRRFASLRPRFAGLPALTPAPRTLVQTGSC